MATECLLNSNNKSIYFLLLAMSFVLIASNTFASDTQTFRIRMHQSIKQDFTAADVTEEIRFGQKVAARLLGIEQLLLDSNLNRYISLIGNSLALHSPRNELDYYFAILNSDTVNAYSSPGGYIFITTGALALAEDESEVAAILAHEIAHITERHVVTELGIAASDQSQLSGFTRFLGSSGNTTQVALQQAVDKAIEIIYKSGYKISDEFQADRIATLLLAQTGYDPLAMKRYLVRAENKSSQHPNQQADQAKTHPTSAERFSQLDKLILSEQLAGLKLPTAKKRFNENVKSGQKSQ